MTTQINHMRAAQVGAPLAVPSGMKNAYECYQASGSTDAYTCWLADRFTEFLASIGEVRPPPTVHHGVVSETFSEWRAAMRMKHHDQFMQWLQPDEPEPEEPTHPAMVCSYDEE